MPAQVGAPAGEDRVRLLGEEEQRNENGRGDLAGRSSTGSRRGPRQSSVGRE
jgi:hypothetical protein